MLVLVTGGMAIIQDKTETDSQAELTEREYPSDGTMPSVTSGKILKNIWHFLLGTCRCFLWRPFLSAVAFFIVSFLTTPAPECLVPGSGIPSNAALIVAILLGTILALSALHGQQLSRNTNHGNQDPEHGAHSGHESLISGR